jgi:hypothetical protein
MPFPMMFRHCTSSTRGFDRSPSLPKVMSSTIAMTGVFGNLDSLIRTKNNPPIRLRHCTRVGSSRLTERSATGKVNGDYTWVIVA